MKSLSRENQADIIEAFNSTSKYLGDLLNIKMLVLVLVLHFVALWFILRGDLFYVLPCVILFLCFQSF